MSDRVRVEHGDCLKVMARLHDDGVLFDSVVTDPPYHLTSITKRFAKTGGADRKLPKKHHQFRRLSKGFMGRTWDGGDIAFRPETWRLVYDLMKPGAYIFAFGGTRTYHRMACAIEDAGFIVHPMKGWLFAQGFPKAHNPKIEGMEGWRYGGQTCKPALEPIFFGQKPPDRKMRDNILAHGVGAMNIDACRVHADDAQGGVYTVKRLKPGATLEKTGGSWRPEVGPSYQGEMKVGRWPANVAHDGSDAVIRALPDAPGQQADASSSSGSRKTQNVYGAMKRGNGRDGEASADRRYADSGSTNFAALPGERRGDEGSAARFFFCAKAGADDRVGSTHPTVKPVALIRWLIRLVTPVGGLVLDPFAGTGTTGVAAIRQGMRAILIEREAEYHADILARLAKLSGADTPLFSGEPETLPLFGGSDGVEKKAAGAVR